MKLEEFINENLLYGRALIDLQVSKKGSNPLWTGFVSTNQGEFPAYIKKCRHLDGLCVEIISSLLGLMLNIPIPKPILVLVEPNHPQIFVKEPTFLFGSQMYDMPSFERFLIDHQLSGDVSNIRGDVSNIRGDVSNISGNVEDLLPGTDVTNMSGDVSHNGDW